MSEIVVNLLPLTPAQQERFRAAAPQAEHRFLPRMDINGGTLREGDPAGFDGATVVIGCPTRAHLSHAPGLKWLQTWSAGTDVYQRPGMLPEGCMLTSAAGAYGPAVSEHLFACLLALCKKLPQYRDEQRNHHWTDRGTVKSLRNALVLVVGAGDIGTAFAGLCKAVGARTVGLKRTVGPVPAAFDALHPISELDRWLPQADVAAFVLPHTPETVHILDEKRLESMKPGSILLNAGRGSAVDLIPLEEVLRSGHLWGAALDVTEPEPLPPDHPLWDVENLILTPHCAGGFHLDVTLARIVDIAVENLRRYAQGEALNNRVQ
ncbi:MULTISPECIES: D-2-hydroxyacid dehydrogenase [Intestinimonas]|uniref:D-2-hydroxyacid dehydrogenase n=1 Tax=Intestinimonas TaxID=1392389 RepID=UPI00067F5EF2|nr:MULTISPECIES: D-2-hydroxyacid dehydrogenase [Intestinimonas]